MDCFVAHAPRNDEQRHRIQLSNSDRTCVRIVAARCARALRRWPPSERKEGAGKTGCALHPRSRVQCYWVGRTRAYRFSGDIPAFPAQWFTAYSALSPAIRICLSPSPALLTANLTPTQRLSGPHGFTVRIRAVRQRRVRVHRIPPRVSRRSRAAPLAG